MVFQGHIFSAIISNVRIMLSISILNTAECYEKGTFLKQFYNNNKNQN